MNLFEDKINFVLNKSSGIKAAIFDTETKKIIGDLISYSLFLKNDFFLFETIENTTRRKISQISAIVILRPISIEYLIDEMKNPKYGEYIILLTNQISVDDLKRLAEADTQKVIKEIYEIYIDIYKIDTKLYSAYPQLNYNRNNNSKINNILNNTPINIIENREKRIIEGIYSFISSLNITPNIRSKCTDPLVTNLIHTLSLTKRNQNKGVLFIYERNEDLITPLLHTWTYQSMIYEYLDSYDGIISISDKIFTLANDEFFSTNKFKNINELSTLLKEFINISKLKVSTDIKEIEKKNKITESLEKHLIIYNNLINRCIKNKEIAEYELEIIKYNNKTLEDIKNHTLNNDYTKEQTVKIILIYLLSNSYITDSSKSKKIEKQINIYFKEYKKYINTFYEYYKPQINDKPQKFLEDTDIKLSYIPKIKKIINKLIDRSLKETEYKYIKRYNKTQEPLIIYFKDGITLHEYEIISQILENKNIEFYILTDQIVGYKNIMKNIIK